jgi:hypothetical protein
VGTLHGAVFFGDETSWTDATVTSVHTLDLFQATEVAKANEVTSAPGDTSLLGTSTLTFAPAETAFEQTLTLSLLESTDFEFRTSGNQPGLEPASNTREDFSVTFSDGVLAFAMILSEQQESSQWSLFDVNDQLIDSFSLGGSLDNRFYGVTSHTRPIFRAEVIHPDSPTDNFGIGTFYFTNVPEPGSAGLLAASALLSLIRRRRRGRSVACG